MESHGSYQRFKDESNSIFVDERDSEILDSINSHAYHFYQRVMAACPNGLKRLAAFGASLVEDFIVTPLATGVSAFFTSRTRKKHWWKPVSDTVMIPGNAVLSLSHLLPINGKGKLGVIAAPTVAIIADLGYLISDAWNTQLATPHRIKNPLAALTALSLGTYSALLTLYIVHRTFNEDESISIGTLKDHTLEALCIYPMDIIDYLAKTQPTQLQKLLLFSTGYISGLNGIILGKDLVLYKAQAGILRFWTNVRTRFFRRHLETVDALQSRIQEEVEPTLLQPNPPDPNQALYTEVYELEEKYQSAVQQEKDWYWIDVVICTLETLTATPALLLTLPNDIAQRMPLVYSLLKKNDLIVNNRHFQYSGNQAHPPHAKAQQTSLFLNTLAYRMGWSDQPAPTSEYLDLNDLRPPPFYDDMMHIMLTHDYKDAFGSLMIESIIGFFTKDSRTPQQMKLERTLKDSFLEAFANYNEGLLQNEPPMPIQEYDRPPTYHNPKLLKQISDHPEFKKLIKGDFNGKNKNNAPMISFFKKAKTFNEFVYAKICYISPYASSENPSVQGTPRHQDLKLPRQNISRSEYKSDNKESFDPLDLVKKAEWMRFHQSVSKESEHSHEHDQRRHSEGEIGVTINLYPKTT